MGDEQNGVDLAAQVTELTAQVAELNAAAAELTVERDAALAKASDAERERDDLNAKVAELTEQAATLSEQIRAASKKAKAVANPSSKLRKAGPIENPQPSELAELIGMGDQVQVVFSDGKREIGALPALDITGRAWATRVTGLALCIPDLTISTVGGGAADLAGYALFIDGQQVAYAARIDVLRIAPGQTMNISNDVIFGG